MKKIVIFMACLGFAKGICDEMSQPSLVLTEMLDAANLEKLLTQKQWGHSSKNPS